MNQKYGKSKLLEAKPLSEKIPPKDPRERNCRGAPLTQPRVSGSNRLTAIHRPASEAQDRNGKTSGQRPDLACAQWCTARTTEAGLINRTVLAAFPFSTRKPRMPCRRPPFQGRGVGADIKHIGHPLRIADDLRHRQPRHRRGRRISPFGKCFRRVHHRRGNAERLHGYVLDRLGISCGSSSIGILSATTRSKHVASAQIGDEGLSVLRRRHHKRVHPRQRRHGLLPLLARRVIAHVRLRIVPTKPPYMFERRSSLRAARAGKHGTVGRRPRASGKTPPGRLLDGWIWYTSGCCGGPL